jgi:hypothetical protein
MDADSAKPTMTPKEFEARMRENLSSLGFDPETAHIEADKLICDLLRSLGYGDGIDLFEEADKWYA